MKKLFRPLGRKLRFVLPVALVYLLAAAGSAFAQSASLTATVRVNPLKVEVTAPGVVTVGEWFEVTAAVSNQGDIAVSKASATINLHSGMRVRGLRKRLGNFASGEEKVVTWLVRAKNPGEYIIQVEVKGKLLGEEISASASDNISVTGSFGAFFFRLIFGV